MSLSTVNPPWVEETPAHLLMLEKTEALQDLFVVAGPELYMVGDQHGGFPPVGYHISGEMSGVWTHPFKLLDGLWLTVRGTGGEACLDRGSRFVVGPGVCEHHQEVPLLGLKATRREWVVDEFPGLVVEYHLRNLREIDVPLEIELNTQVNLRPSWRAEDLLIRDGVDIVEFDEDEGLIRAEDELNGWALVLGTSRTPLYCQTGCKVPGRELANGAILMFAAHIEAGAWFTLRVYLAASGKSAEEAAARYQRLLGRHEEFLVQRAGRFMQASRRSRVKSGDPALDRALMWARMGFESLEARMPPGAGVVGGYPEHPWLCTTDMCLSVGAALAAGRADLARRNLATLADLARAGGADCQIPLEVTPLGARLDRPSQMLPLALFVSALRTYFDWTGDRSFLEQCFPVAEALLRRIPAEAMSHAMLPTGGGFLEKPGLAHRTVDTAAVLVEALRDLAELQTLLGTPTLVNYCRKRADDLEFALNQAFWNSDVGLYADMLAPGAAVERAVEGCLSRARGAPADQVRAYLPAQALKGTSDLAWLGRHWITVVPLVAGTASPAQAAQAFARLETGEFIASWGLMTQAALDKKVTALGTALLAIAQARYGRMDPAFQTMKRIALSLQSGMPGAFSEFLPSQGSCLRPWAGSGLIRCFVHHVMGIRPALGARRVDFLPRLPSTVPAMAIENLDVGGLAMSFRCARLDDGSLESSVAADRLGPHVFIACPMPADAEVEVSKDGGVMRKWDTEEKVVEGQRYVGVCVPLAAGTHTVRVRVL